MEFKVGDRVKVVNLSPNSTERYNHDKKGKIVGNHAMGSDFLMVQYDDGNYEGWHPNCLKKLEPETQSEYKIGDEIIVSNEDHVRRGKKGKIAGNHAEPNFLMIQYDDGSFEEWETNDIKKLVPETQPGYKIGDRILAASGEAVVIGFGYNPVVFYRYKDGRIDWDYPRNLKLVSSPLKKGQEVWVKAEIYEVSDGISSPVVRYPHAGGNLFCSHEFIYIKNSKGQIVPYVDK